SKCTIKNPQNVKTADIIIGIPSLNEADNIRFVVETVDKGLRKYYKKYKCVIINVDNNSPDGTGKVFMETKTVNPKIYVSTCNGVRGKGNNFLNLFNQVKELDAQAVTVVDADMQSITPEWVKAFLDPILNKKYDFVTPYYSRNEYDGTITNNIAYPLVYGLYGIDLRQPIGGDFSFSSRIVNSWIAKKWHKPTKQYGVDIFMTLEAIIGDYKICQVSLGQKIHKPSAPKLGPMFSQVVATILKQIIISKDKWMKTDKVVNIPMFGRKKSGHPQPMGVDYKSMKITSIFEYKINRDILKRALTPEIFGKIDDMYKEEEIDIGKTLWTKVLYDCVYAYDTTDLNMGLVEALRPLYFGRLISFIRRTLDMSHEESEEEIKEQAKRFWELRQYLIEKYK
ncbi:MAG TPA: glycosyltransferase, partial [Candidatus Moranbacteria bacterium]|nr:glycosyltransferase [Candidatus Moranbacteria bacterium]